MPDARPMLTSAPGPTVEIDGRRHLYFAGTAYLGLQSDPRVIDALCEAARRYGVSTATARTGHGGSPPLADVERAAAEFYGSEASLYYATGYASAALIAHAANDAFDAVFLDEHAHYSIDDAAAATGRPMRMFRHCDADHLRASLKQYLRPGERPLVMTDGVFAVLGDVAPVDAYLDVLGAYDNANLFIDDAHGLGVLGAHGRGTFEHFGVDCARLNQLGHKDDAPACLVAATCSKAIGGYGGVVPGSRASIDALQYATHVFAGSTPPPTPIAAATAAAMRIVIAEPLRRERLCANARHLRDGLRALGLDVNDAPTPIVCVTLDSAESMQRVQRDLAARSIMIAYIPRYSGVGVAGALRLAVFATHEPAMIDELLTALREVV